MNCVQCNLCTFCKEEQESIKHLLWGYPIVADIWHHLNAWIFETTNIEIPLNVDIVMFDLYDNYKLNFIKKAILLLKYFIYRSKMQSLSICLMCKCLFFLLACLLYHVPL